MKKEIKERIEAVRHGKTPDGYYETVAGIMPTDWSSAPLHAISEVLSEQVADREFETLSISAGIGFVNQAEKFGKELSGKQYTKYTVLRRGDFAYNKGNSKRYPQGCTYMLRERDEAAVPNVFECFRITQGHPEYYEQLFINGFMNKQLMRKINHGVRDDGLLNLTDDDFYSTFFPVPPLTEQQKIAEILATCDRVIELKQQLLEEKRRQKKWLMQKLLDPNSGTRVPGFEQSEWIEVSLLDCCIKKGEYGLNAPACEYAPELPRYIRITDIDDNGKYMKDAPVSVNVSDAEEYYLREGDLLFVRTGGTTGKVYRYENGDGLLVYAGFLIRFSVNLKDYDDSFIYSQFSTMGYTNWVKVMSMRSGQPGINAEEYGSFSFWAPKDKAEQSAIAAVFKCKDREIELLQKDLRYWRQKKKALMQLLLTGLVRVNA